MLDGKRSARFYQSLVRQHSLGGYYGGYERNTRIMVGAIAAGF